MVWRAQEVVWRGQEVRSFVENLTIGHTGVCIPVVSPWYTPVIPGGKPGITATLLSETHEAYALLSSKVAPDCAPATCRAAKQLRKHYRNGFQLAKDKQYKKQ